MQRSQGYLRRDSQTACAQRLCLAAPVGIIRRIAERVFERMIDRRIQKRLHGLFILEVNRQVAVPDIRVISHVIDVVSRDRVDGADQVVRLVQPVTLFPVPCQCTRGDPVQVFKTDTVGLSPLC
jgi:hypothetical protein